MYSLAETTTLQAADARELRQITEPLTLWQEGQAMLKELTSLTPVRLPLLSSATALI